MSTKDRKKQLATSMAVGECLIFETPPPTPEHMIKFRKKHQKKPGLRIVHHGLRDQKLPPASFTYGIIGEAGVSSVTDHINDLWKDPYKTEISQYISNQNEVYYSRNKKEPLGKAMPTSTIVPSNLVNDPNFAFGLKSVGSEITTKQLLTDKQQMKTPQIFSRMSLTEQQNEERELVQKRDMHYDWNKLNIDPSTYCFGSPPRNSKKISIKQLKHSSDGVKEALYFDQENFENNSTIQDEKKISPMPDDFVYGKPKQTGSHIGAKECIRGTDEEIKRFTEYQDIAKRRNEQVPYVYEIATKPNFHKDGVTAQTLLNPSKSSEIGIGHNHLTTDMPFNEIKNILSNANIPINLSAFESIVNEKYSGRISIDAAMKEINQL